MTLAPLDPDTGPEASAELLRTVRASYGTLPNLTRVMANSPALLRGYLAFAGALDDGELPLAVREQIALVIAEGNGCAYCLSAHTYVAERAAQLTRDEIGAARRADSADARTRAALRLASAVNAARGELGGAELASAREARLTDGDIAEIIGHVALNVLTNYFAKAARVEIDFPLVKPHDHAA